MVLEANRELSEESLPDDDVIRETGVDGGVKRAELELARHLELHGCEFYREGELPRSTSNRKA